jgi:hypothetical protein
MHFRLKYAQSMANQNGVHAPIEQIKGVMWDMIVITIHQHQAQSFHPTPS